MKSESIDNGMQPKLHSASDVSPLNNNAIISDGNHADINGGTLWLATVLFVGTNGTDYVAIGAFTWETMPNRRKRDTFAIIRDVTTTSRYTQTAQGEYEFKYIDYGPYGTDNLEKTSTTTVDFNDLKSCMEGYAFEYHLPLDLADTYKDSSGNPVLFVSKKFISVSGQLLYQGAVKNNSDRIEHTIKYEHQTFSLTANGIDFSVPFGVTFSISKTTKYTELCDEHLWIRY